jgi:hypothetical protein
MTSWWWMRGLFVCFHFPPTKLSHWLKTELRIKSFFCIVAKGLEQPKKRQQNQKTLRSQLIHGWGWYLMAAKLLEQRLLEKRVASFPIGTSFTLGSFEQPMIPLMGLLVYGKKSGPLVWSITN